MAHISEMFYVKMFQLKIGKLILFLCKKKLIDVEDFVMKNFYITKLILLGCIKSLSDERGLLWGFSELIVSPY